MGFIGRQPAHPQEACIFLLLAIGRAFYIVNRTLRMILIGTLGGAMVTSKINLGVFVFVALTVGFTYGQSPGWWRDAACLAVTLGALALPVVLMWDLLTESWAMSYCALMVLSLASVLLTVWVIPLKSRCGVRDAAVVAAAFAGTAAAICCFPLAHGSTFHNLFEWLIVVPRRNYGQCGHMPAHMHSGALIWAVTGLILAWYVAKRRLADQWLAIFKFVFGAAVLLMCVTGRYGGLFNLAPPFLWLVAVRPANALAGTSSRETLARALLVLVAVVQVLYAYPVAGSQVGSLTVLMIVVAGICLWDGISWMQSGRFEARASNRTPAWLPSAAR